MVSIAFCFAKRPPKQLQKTDFEGEGMDGKTLVDIAPGSLRVHRGADVHDKGRLMQAYSKCTEERGDVGAVMRQCPLRSSALAGAAKVHRNLPKGARAGGGRNQDPKLENLWPEGPKNKCFLPFGPKVAYLGILIS